MTERYYSHEVLETAIKSVSYSSELGRETILANEVCVLREELTRPACCYPDPCHRYLLKQRSADDPARADWRLVTPPSAGVPPQIYYCPWCSGRLSETWP